ncbi:E3 ubiquitin-protein ligase TRIM7-like isoform X3 [Acipenser ruthenus]|uniref:E3 ubiquitin-protein ligase TRIM7-like isoform X3 n=1 Tax=Acipenser ruthenus TaxID=7906 RepID=UPI0027407082|nr:E3 ubiquitin-protein ligase TRIM7-like isoform X3 [Acipenser ruthenus]
MEKETADVETVSGASGILSVSQSFGSFGRDYKSINPARDAKSMSWDRPYLSNPKIPGLLKRVFKGSDRKSRHQEVGEWSLEECRHSIMELAKEMNRVLKNSAIPTPVSSEDTCSLEECRCFIMKWAGELDKLVQTPKQSQSAGQVETRKGAELRNKEDLPGPEGEELSEGAGQNQGEELDQEEEQRLKDGHDIIMQWARELKTVPENSVSAGEAVEQGVAELVKEWKRGKLSNILPIMEFIMWTLIKEEAKGMLKSQNIGAGRSIPDLVWQWIHKASVDSLTLDLDTAHPRLTLPVDEKHVRRKRQDHNNPQRFDYRRCVLGKEGFTSGRHYWELGVGENTFWRLGVSRESAPKKGKFSMTPQQGYWTVGWSGDEDKDEFTALTDPQTPLPPSLKPQKLGVYLDYEEGQLSFYNVETRSHIYTFTDMEFNPNEKLYPFFWSLEYKDLALVSPGKMNDSFFFLLVWKWILAASVDVTLDPDTAHPQLTLSAEGKRVRRGGTWQDLPNTPQRFNNTFCVLGREGFTSGRRYWQVQVGGNTYWRLGVSRESAKRKGGFSMTPQQGYWTVEWRWSRDEFTALTDPRTPLPLSLKPQKLGVYLDYEEGQLSFYNVETRSHIYTFTDMEFNPNEKLYPFFCTYSNTDLVLESPDVDPVSAAD